MLIFNWRGMFPVLAMLLLTMGVGYVLEKGMGLKFNSTNLPASVGLGGALILSHWG